MASWLVAAGLAALLALAAALAAYGLAYARWAEAKWPPLGRFVETPEGRLHVIERGEGPLVIALHGASANAREWRPVWDLLAPSFRVAAMDRPGHGHSSPIARQDELAAQAAAAARLIEALGRGPAIVLAHSLGCACAVRLAIDRPDLVNGLVLCAPATHPYPGENAWHVRLAAAPVIGILFARLAVPIAGPARIKKAVENTFAPASAPPGYVEEVGVALLFRPRTFRANAREVAASKREFEGQYFRYDEIARPTVIVSTDLDRVVAPRLHAKALKRTIPGAELLVAPGAGHMPHRIAPETVADAVRKVAQRLAPASAQR